MVYRVSDGVSAGVAGGVAVQMGKIYLNFGTNIATIDDPQIGLQ